MIVRHRSQILARRAYEVVARRQSGDETEEKYLSFARSMPTLLHTCGLAQATAFAAAKKGHHAKLLADLAEVMDVQFDGERSRDNQSQTDQLLHDARHLPSIRYMHLSREALAAATWIKRYSEALLKENKPGRSQNDQTGD